MFKHQNVNSSPVVGTRSHCSSGERWPERVSESERERQSEKVRECESESEGESESESEKLRVSVYIC